MFRGLPRLKTKFEAKNDCTNALGGTTASETPTGRVCYRDTGSKGRDAGLTE